MKRVRNQRGLISIGCAVTMCALTSLNKAPDPTVSPPAQPLHKGHIQTQSDAEKSWEESYQGGDALYQSGRYDEAYKVWAETLRLAQKQHAASKFDDVRALPVLEKLALLYKTQQQPQMAAQMYEREVAIATKQYGRASSQVAHTMLELGHVYRYGQSKNYGKAQEVLSEAFSINEKLYGHYTIPTGDVAIALAQLEEDLQNFQKAAQYWQLAVEIGNRCEPNTISCCRIGPRQGLARCYEKLGRLDDALAVHKELVAMCRTGAKSMLPTVLSGYAQCLEKMGRHAEATSALAEISH